MRTVILAICLGAASAFMGAPVAHRAAGKSSMSMVAKSPAEVGNQGGMDELGITSPIGYWDPWGFNTSPEKFYRYRQVELKHGRIAQAAMLGLLVQENFRFPGAIDLEGTQFADIPNGLAALPAVPGFGWVQIVFLVGVLEAGPFRQTPDKPIGDFGLKYFGVKYPDGDIKADKLNKELNNGRLAMMGFLGAIVEDKITGSFLPVGIPGVDFTPGA
jgi:light-harvesting complex I chlorophyll a/b binding protein 1